MVGYIAQTGQMVTVDFRRGNVPPNKDNLAFIKQCQQSLPAGVKVSALRIDSSGYQFRGIEAGGLCHKGPTTVTFITHGSLTLLYSHIC